MLFLTQIENSSVWHARKTLFHTKHKCINSSIFLKIMNWNFDLHFFKVMFTLPLDLVDENRRGSWARNWWKKKFIIVSWYCVTLSNLHHTMYLFSFFMLKAGTDGTSNLSTQIVQRKWASPIMTYPRYFIVLSAKTFIKIFWIIQNEQWQQIRFTLILGNVHLNLGLHHDGYLVWIICRCKQEFTINLNLPGINDSKSRQTVGNFVNHKMNLTLPCRFPAEPSFPSVYLQNVNHSHCCLVRETRYIAPSIKDVCHSANINWGAALHPVSNRNYCIESNRWWIIPNINRYYIQFSPRIEAAWYSSGEAHRVISWNWGQLWCS